MYLKDFLIKSISFLLGLKHCVWVWWYLRFVGKWEDQWDWVGICFYTKFYQNLAFSYLISMVNFLLIVLRGNIIIKQRPREFLENYFIAKIRIVLISRTLICIYFDLYLLIHINAERHITFSWNINRNNELYAVFILWFFYI